MDEVMEAQRIEWQKEVIDAAIHLIYENSNACGIMRAGSYNLSENVFRIAIDEYLKSGIDALDEYDSLQYLSFDRNLNSPMDNEVHLVSKEDIELFNTALDGNNFWDIYSMFNDEVISEIKDWVEYSISRYEWMDSYEYRRRGEFGEDLKKQVKKRDGNKCIKCGSKLLLEVHHIKPLIDGGDNSMENLMTLCHSHHVLAHKKLSKGGGR